VAQRVLLYTGKGGVGKTTCAAATALRCAELGYRTVVLSTDSAHSLGDSLDMELGPEPSQIAPNLWAQETDVYYSLRMHWGTVQAWLSALLAWRGVDDTLAEEMAILPGMEELSSLLWVNMHHEAGEFDVVVVDCAPTAETLRLLAFPEDARWWLERILPIKRRVARVVNPVLETVIGVPTPGSDVFNQAEELVRQLGRLRDLLADRQRASVRLVLNPERMVIREAQRTLTYLTLYGYGTDLVVCNRVLPESVRDAYFAAWHESQKKHLEFIDEAFSPLPIRQVPLFPQEAVGIDMLAQTATELFAEDVPHQLFYDGRSHSVQREAGGYVLDIELPFVQKGDVEVVKRGDELTVRIGIYRRSIVLPTILARLSPGTARLEERTLRIPFAESAEAAATTL
jgi:arsenite-transporting ATPase